MTKQPDTGIFIEVGEFNQTTFRTVFHRFHQLVQIPNRRWGMALLPLPTCSQLIKVKPSVKTVWTDTATADLRDCFGCTVWQLFKDAAIHQYHQYRLEEYKFWMTIDDTI